MVEQLKEISLGDGSGEVAIRVNGVRIDVHTSGDVDVYGDVDVASHRAPQQTPSLGELRIGNRMPDGTIYAGISPDTGKPMYAAASDAPLTMKWKAAMEFATLFAGHEHKDWRLPTKEELTVLFNNRAAIGGFKEGAFNGHWSATDDWNGQRRYAVAQTFWAGCGPSWTPKANEELVRLVRS